MSAFSKGDRVEYIDNPSSIDRRPKLIGKTGTVEGPHPTVENAVTVRWDDRHAAPNGILKTNLRKVEPEWVVGQQVRDKDYVRLPVGSVVEGYGWVPRGWSTSGVGGCKPLTKVSDTEWDDGRRHDAAGLYDPRTLTHLGDGTHVTEPSVDNSEDITEPEDADDVEPEPLKEGDWVQVWAQVTRRTDDSGEFEHLIRERDDSGLGSYHLWQVHPDAIVRPDAGQVPPWVKPAPVKPEEPDVLGAVVYSDSNGKFWTRASIDPEESHVWAGAYDKCWFNWRQLPDDVVVWDPSDPARGGAS